MATKMEADHGNKHAMIKYSELLEKGIGVGKNDEEVMRYKLMSTQINENCLIQ